MNNEKYYEKHKEIIDLARAGVHRNKIAQDLSKDNSWIYYVLRIWKQRTGECFLYESVKKALESPRNKQVVALAREGKTMKSIGDSLGVTKQRVQQILKKVACGEQFKCLKKCKHCNKESHSIVCDECKPQVDKHPRYRKSNSVTGLCVCGKPFLDGYKVCEDCRKKRSEWSRVRYQKRKEKKQCVRCVKPTFNERAYCENCIEQQYKKLKKYKKEIWIRKICSECNKEFDTTSRGIVYCSEDCSKEGGRKRKLEHYHATKSIHRRA